MACRDCFTGHVHEGEPKGQITKLHGLDTYVSEPTTGKPAEGIIVIVPDAFGWDLVNTRLLADRYAEKGGFKVYLPDFMNGYSAPWSMFESVSTFNSPTSTVFQKVYHTFRALYAFLPWIIANRVSRTHPTVTAFLTQLRASESLPIAAAGFCWGGKHVVLLAQGESTPDGKPLLDAAFTGHPSWIKVPDDVAGLKVPTSFALADKDTQLPLEQAAKLKGVVEELSGEAKGEVRIYEGCGHGFCLRADVSVKESEIARQASEAEDQCVAWFKEKLRR